MISSKTKARTFRISTTHDYFLQKRYGEKASALVRVLLSLYFNKKLESFNIDSLLEENAKSSRKLMLKKLDDFNTKLKAQKLEKAS